MPNNINTKNSGGFATKIGRDGKGTPANLQGQKDGFQNPSLQDKDANNLTNVPNMQAKTHWSTQKDGGIDKWGIQNKKSNN